MEWGSALRVRGEGHADVGLIAESVNDALVLPTSYSVQPSVVLDVVRPSQVNDERWKVGERDYL